MQNFEGDVFFIPPFIFLINHEITQISTRKQKIHYGRRLTQMIRINTVK